MAATIDIIGKSGVKHSAVFEEESVRKFELMKEDYVRLVFSTKEQFAVSLGDYIEIGSGFNAALGGRFEITKPQRPTFNTQTGGYDYDLQFDAPHYKWNNKLFKFEPSTKRNEASWSLTDNLQNHMAVFLRNLEYYGWEYTVDPASYQMASASRVIFIQYNNKYLLDALTQIAEAFECEWWITDNVIHLGKAESGSAIDFTIGQNVESMGSEKGEQEYITRLYGFGSTRNLPPDYRQNDEQVLLNGVVQKRVMLPVATPYVDIAEGLSDDEVVEGIVVFDDVYPQLDCHVTDVHTDMREVKDEDSDDEEATITVPIYRFKDSSLLFSKEYILPGQQLQVQFQSGRLNGMIFDLAFNPDDVAEDSENGQWFEIVRNETYGLFLPNDTLMPAVHDSFVLLGWNVRKLESGLGLITAAENKVLARTREYAAKLQIDPNVYPCKMMADYMYGLRGTHQDSTATKVGTFYLGQRIRLNNTNFFEGGSRLSRVIGYEYKLDKPYDGATIYVGESATYSSRKATQDAINEVSETITYKGGNYSGSGSSGGGSVYIITTNDDSTPTDANVYSALRTERQFARKDRDDAISSLWTFNHGYGAKRGIQTKDYKDYGDANEENLFGKGFELVEKGDGNGGTKTRMEVDELFVRIKAFFAQLEIREMSYVGGNYAFSSAGSKIYFVEWLDALGNRLPKVAGNVGSIYTFRCYLYSDDGTTATMNKWASDDQALCETFNIDSGVHQNTSNKRYWRRVTGIGKGVIQDSGDTTQYQYVDISMTDCETGSAYPEAEDTIVQLGNWSNASRQGVIYLKVEGSGSPAIMEYSGVGANGQHFVLPAPTLLLSPSKNVIYGEFHSVVDEGGGGNTGAGETIEDQLRALIERLNDIQNQADKKFDIWFGTGVPLPSADNPTATANYPASEWTTEALKALHSQDIYYNTNREPASTGGRAWRWIAVESNGTVTYWWDEILDADTLAALEKIADVASDGIITGGAEKTRVYIDWMKALREYYEYKERAEDYEITDEWTAYRTAFLNLGKMLNNNVDMVPNPDGSYDTPAWLTDLLSETTIPSPVTYRQRWNDYYAALAVLLQTITKKAKELADAAQETADEAIQTLTEYASDGYLTPDEKLTVKREFIAAFHEMNDSTENGRPAGILDQASDGNNGYIIAAAIVNLYINAYKSVGQYLNGGNTWNIPNTEEIADAALPSWLQAANMTRTENITTDSARASWLSVWENFYSARTAVLTALTEKAQDTADGAHDRIDDIVNDGIISGGSEKCQLYKEWMRTKEEYFDYYARANGYGFNGFNTKPNNSTEYGYYQDYLAFNNAFDALVLMMNGGTYGGGQSEVNKDHTNRTVLLYNGDQLAWLYNLQADTVIGNYSYTDNGSSVAYTAAKYRQLWNTYYYASVKLLNDFTEYSKALADEALHQLEEITDDGKITPAEKNTILLNWREVITEYPVIKAQADTYTNALASGDLKTSLQSAASAYILAFNTLATLLNGGTTYSYTFSPANFPTPSWLGTYFERTEELTSQQKENFNAAWDGYYNTRTALQDIFVDVAKKSGDDALGELDNLAADDVLTPFEKLTVLREWDAAYAEYTKLTAQADKTHVGYAAYTAAFYRLGNYLYDKTDSTTDRHVTYSTMANSILVADGDTAINGSLFKTLWSNYYKERTDLVAAISVSHVSYFVSASDTPPTPPFKVGDLWLQSDTNEMMVCIQSLNSGTNAYTVSSYWANMKDITEKRDPRLLIASMVNLVYTYDGGFIRNKESDQYVNIYLGATIPSTANANGDMAYGANSNVVKRYESGSWVTIDNDLLQNVFKSVYGLTGTYTIRIFKLKPSITPNLYDCICSQIVFTDTNFPVGNEYREVEGGIYIRMYNGTDWEVLQESNHSVIQNLPGYIRAVAMASANGVVNSSGFITSSDWATLFSQATDADGNILAQAHLGTFVTKVSDGNGGYKIQSGVKIDGDQVNITAGDAISLAISNAVAGVKGYGPNLLPHSIINETSNAYGFGKRYLKLEAGKSYTLSASGIVPTSLPSNMVLKVFIYRRKDSTEASTTSEIGYSWAWSRSFNITQNGGAARTASVSFTADKTATYEIESYLYDTNEAGTNGTGNSGTRTYPVTILWYKVEEGSVATSWVPEESDGNGLDNFIVNPLAVTGTKEENADFTTSEVTDGTFGKVLQVSHNVNGHWQLLFTRRDTYSLLTGNDATFYVICKNLATSNETYVQNSGGTLVPSRLCFGYDDSGTQIVVDTISSPFVDLGNGWRKYYATKRMTSALGSTVGICHVMGSWRIYAVGIVLGGVCPLVAEIMSKNNLLSTGIDITTGIIKLRADKVSFESSDGTVTNKISIDPTTGTLKATDADIAGKVTASSGKFGNLVISGDYFYADNGVLRFGLLGDSYTIMSTSQQELARNANLYMMNDSSYCIFATTMASGRAAIIAYGSTAIESQGKTSLQGGLIKKLTKISSAYTVLKTDSIILCEGSSAYTVTLPTDAVTGQQFTIISDNTANVTIAASGSDVIRHSNLRAHSNFLGQGSVVLPANVDVHSETDGWSGDTTTYYSKAYGVILVYNATDHKWYSRYII